MRQMDTQMDDLQCLIQPPSQGW